jgi:hypothetical protein
MTPEEIVTLQINTAFCHDKWQEANRESASDWAPHSACERFDGGGSFGYA